MVKAYYLGAEISEMIAYIGDIVVFAMKDYKYASIAFMSEIVLEVK